MSFLDAIRNTLFGQAVHKTASTIVPAPKPGRVTGELPAFTAETADQMRFDPQVRIGLAARNGLIIHARAEAKSSDPRIAKFVQAQWDHLWRSTAHILLRAKLYGFLPIEMKYKQQVGGEYDGAWVFDTLRDFHPRDARILLRNGEVAGFRLFPNSEEERNVLAPLGLVCTFDSEFGNPYGVSLLERAYSPWFEKWMEGGAKKLLRLRMLKDAYIGDVFWYPADRNMTLASGQVVSWRDIAREMAESRQAGGSLTLPLMYDGAGKRLVDYTPPKDVGAATSIFDWNEALDHEIWKAIEIPPEIIEAARVGSGWSGRSVPLIVAVSAVQLEFAEIVRSVERDVIRGLVELNFGPHHSFELRPLPLVDHVAHQLFNGSGD